MLKKTMTYTDYEGVKRTEDFYFNLTKAECAEFLYSRGGRLDKIVEKVASRQDSRETMDIFKDLILRSYGEKSPDGRRFIKSKELSEAFSQTEAYSDLFMSIASDASVASEFFNAIIPDVPAKGIKQAGMSAAISAAKSAT